MGPQTNSYFADSGSAQLADPQYLAEKQRNESSETSSLRFLRTGRLSLAVWSPTDLLNDDTPSKLWKVLYANIMHVLKADLHLINWL